MNVQRNIRRRNEIVYWAPLPRQYNLLRLSLAGQLHGIRAPAAGRGLKIVPYFAGDLARSDERRRTTALGDAGVDLKYAITPALTLDLTYNTDFAQVEVDQQQINLDRFNLFFPEKRPFFLENAGVFSVSSVRQVAGGNPGQTELFFSRRIGIDENGREIRFSGAPVSPASCPIRCRSASSTCRPKRWVARLRTTSPWRGHIATCRTARRSGRSS